MNPNTPPSGPDPRSYHPAEARFDELLDAHLAGDITPAQRSELAELVRVNADLAAQLRFHESAAASIRSLFTPPVAPPIAPMNPESASPVVSGAIGPRRTIAWLTAAAVLALAAFLGLRLSGVIGGPGSIPQGPESPQAIYARVVSQGFKPKVLCPNDPDSFARLVKNRLGTEVVPAGLSSAIALTGWSYKEDIGTPISPGTIVLLATNGDAKILVFMDRAKSDRTLESPALPLRLFRQESGPLVFYELTPLPEPSILPSLTTR